MLVSMGVAVGIRIADYSPQATTYEPDITVDTQPDARTVMDGIDMLNERIANLEQYLADVKCNAEKEETDE